MDTNKISLKIVIIIIHLSSSAARLSWPSRWSILRRCPRAKEGEEQRAWWWGENGHLPCRGSRPTWPDHCRPIRQQNIMIYLNKTLSNPVPPCPGAPWFRPPPPSPSPSASTSPHPCPPLPPSSLLPRYWVDTIRVSHQEKWGKQRILHPHLFLLFLLLFLLLLGRLLLAGHARVVRDVKDPEFEV